MTDETKAVLEVASEELDIAAWMARHLGFDKLAERLTAAAEAAWAKARG